MALDTSDVVKKTRGMIASLRSIPKSDLTKNASANMGHQYNDLLELALQTKPDVERLRLRPVEFAQGVQGRDVWSTATYVDILSYCEQIVRDLDED